MGTRVLSLWLPYLAIDRVKQKEARSAPGQSHRPHATYLGGDGDQPLVALCPRAERAGLRPGMGRADASRQVPGLVVSPSDPIGDEQILATCVSWCERYTPFVAVDRSALLARGAALWLDIGGSAHLSGGEASLLAGLLGQLRDKGLTARAAIADHPGSAWAACRFGDDEQRILPANGAHVALASLPVAALRLERADCDRLKSAGLDRIEHLYALPRRSLGTRFGDHVVTRLDQALGLIDEPIAINAPLPAQQAQMIFADPITDPDSLPPLIERLLRQLCIGLEAAGLGARRLTLAIYRVDNSTVTCTVGTDRPSRDVQRLSALICNRFDDIDLGFGLERAILDAVEIQPLICETIRWRGLGTAADEAQPDLAQIQRQDPHRRERLSWRGRQERRRELAHEIAPEAPIPPFLRTEPSEAAAMTSMNGNAATALALHAENIEQPALRETSPRPLRLLRQPEPIEAIASLPEEPPVLFRWRQRLHKVTGARGPETVAPEWWRLPEADDPPGPRKSTEGRDNSPAARDYFAVEDSEGERFWLFREGRYGATGALPRWFLHGVFG